MKARLIYSTAFVLAIGAACHKTRTFTLPDRPMKPSVAFVALYEGTRAREVGPVVPYQRIYSGGYSLESGKTGLEARLFFVEDAELQREANQRCGDLPDAVQKVACRDRVTDCERDPSSCLFAKLKGEGCVDRLALSSALELTEFRADADGDLKAAPDDSTSLDDLELCGPSLAVSCPILLPGFVVTEEGRYRCTAPSRQRGCALEVDLSVCGLGRASGDISEDGTVLPVVPVAGCASEALTANESLSDGGGFAVQCESRRFVASYMMKLIGETTCARRGPTIYNNPLYDAGSSFSTDGFVRGVKYAKFPGWSPRLLFAGTGVDGCAEKGCFLTSGCGQCALECNELITLPDCANANSWDPCTTKNTVAECQRRCEDTCNRHPTSCSSVLEGHAVSIAKVDEPEAALSTIDLDLITGTTDAITGAGSLVLVPHRDRTLVAVAGRREVRLFEPLNGDQLEELFPLAPTTLDFDVAGMITRDREVLLFGRTPGANSIGVLMHVSLTDEPDPRLSYDTRVSLGLATADAAAVIGEAGELIALASLDPPLNNTPADVAQLALVAASGTDPLDSLRLDGAPTALGSLAGGAALAGIRRASGETSLEVIVANGSSSARVAASLALPKGLIPKAMLSDPKTCENAADPCITYVGFELEGANRDNGRAVVGIVEHERGNPAGAKLIPSFIETISPELTLLEIDTERDVLYAVASAANRITPIQLAR